MGFLPYAYLVAALVLVWLERDSGETKSWERLVGGVLGLLVGAGILVTQSGLAPGADLAVFGGLLLAGIAFVSPRSFFGSAAVGVASGSALLTMQPEPKLHAFHVMFLSASAAAGILLGGSAEDRPNLLKQVSGFCLAAASVALANAWTTEQFGSLKGQVGTIVGGTAVLGMLIAAIWAKVGTKNHPILAQALGCLAIPVGAFLVSGSSTDEGQVLILSTAGVALAGILAWAWPTGDHRALGPILGGMITLGLATYAFSIAQSFGLSVVLASAGLAWVILGRLDLLLVLGPLVGLLGFRTLRIAFPDVTRAFDIGQHYALIGVTLGVGAILVGLECWQVLQSRGRLGQLLGGVLALALGAVVLFGLMFLGVKGGVGLMVGLGLGAWISSLARPGSIAATIVSLGLIGVVGALYGRASEFFEASRQEKTSAFLLVAGVMAVLVFLALFATREKQSSTKDEVASHA